MKYQPPYTITPAIVNFVAEIGETIGRYTVLAEQKLTPRLRRENRIRTIQASLAIENNTLTLEQVTAVIEGKRVLGHPREIQEVRNAFATYEAMEDWDASVEEDLLAAHELLMRGLVDETGRYRSGVVGIFRGEQLVHMAPPADRVPHLMADLLGWLAATDAHPLIAGSVFHYEFEFIHPFADGNGRMGRLWQSLILARWNPLFADIPVESLIFEHQAEYYQAIQESTQKTDSAPFIAFMLLMILDTVISSTPEVTLEVPPEVRLLSVLAGEMTRQQLKEALGLKDDEHFRKAYLLPALGAGLVEMTIPDKPRSSKQKYRLTDKGRQWLAQHGDG